MVIDAFLWLLVLIFSIFTDGRLLHRVRSYQVVNINDQNYDVINMVNNHQFIEGAGINDYVPLIITQVTTADNINH